MSGELIIRRDPSGLVVLHADRVVELSLELLNSVERGETTGATYGLDRRLTISARNGTWVYRVTGPAGPTSMWAALESGDTNPTPPPPAPSGLFDGVEDLRRVAAEQNDQGPDGPAPGGHDNAQENPT